MSKASRPALPRASASWALFLDVDGCLIEFEHAPQAVVIPHSLRDLLAQLQQALGGAVALVSGRPLAQLDALFRPLQLPSAGLYGLERRSADGQVYGTALPSEQAIAQVRRRTAELASEFPRLRVEDKTWAFALHYREAPELESIVAAAADAIVAPLAGEYEVQPGAMVRELKPVACSKGAALRAFRREAPFLGRLPVFLGDDYADESAFDAVNAAGGISICVGAERSTQATYALPSPAEARAWLAEVLVAVSAVEERKRGARKPADPQRPRTS